MKNHLILITALFLFVSSYAQITMDSLIWEKVYGGEGEYEMFDLIQDYRGKIVFTGVNKNKSGEENLFLGMVDVQSGNPIVPNIQVDKGGQERGKALLQLHDGRLISAGYTEAPKNNNKDALLCLFEADGKLLWDTVLFRNQGNDIFDDLAEDAGGNVFFSGQIDGRLGIAKWSRDGEFTFLTGEMASEDAVTRVVIGKEGNIYLLGRSHKRNTHLYLADFAQKKLRSLVFFEDVVATDLLITSDGNLLVSGHIGFYQENVCLMLFSEKGELIWKKVLEDKGRDYAFSICEHPTGIFCVAGSSTSYEPGAGRTKFYLNCFDSEGNVCWEKPFFYGGTASDEARRVIALQDGSLLMAGVTNSNILGRKGRKPDILLSRLKGPLLKSKSIILSLSGTNGGGCRLIGENGKSVLRAGEWSFLPVQIQNKGPVDAHFVYLYLEKDRIMEGVTIPDSFFVGTINARTEKSVFIPVNGEAYLENGQNRINIRAGNSYMYQKETTPLISSCLLESVGKARPHLSLRSSHKSPISILPNHPFQVEVMLQNDGAAKISDVILAYLPQSCGIQAVGESSIVHSQLLPGETIKHAFQFKLDPDFIGEWVPLQFYAYPEGEQRLETHLMDTVLLEQFLYPPLPGSEDLAVHLVQPSEKRHCDIPLVEKREYIDVKAVIVSRSPFPGNLCRGCEVIVNETQAKGGVITRLPEPHIKDGLYYYEFEQPKVYLQGHAKNAVRVAIKQDELAANSGVAYVKSIPIDLHLITIGVPSDLRYTTNDADSIAAAFERQEGIFYRSVKVKKLNTVENTTKLSLASALEEAVHQYEAGQIDTTDMFILFISSHGEVANLGDSKTSFRIQPSNYDAEKVVASSLGYQEDIVEDYLSRIKCKKLILIDACHSGGKGGYIANRLIEHMKKPAGEVTLASCKENQKAYECQNGSCDNGIFTQAILDALYRRVPAKEIDLDGKGTIELYELYEYLRARVPKMAMEEYAFGAQQTPTISDNYKKLDWESLTLFAY